jgi:hypothetical protein
MRQAGGVVRQTQRSWILLLGAVLLLMCAAAPPTAVTLHGAVTGASDIARAYGSGASEMQWDVVHRDASRDSRGAASALSLPNTVGIDGVSAPDGRTADTGRPLTASMARLVARCGADGWGRAPPS